MADEIQIQIGMTIVKDNVRLFQNALNAFTADMNGKFGPTPGAVVATTSGTDVDLSFLTVPGWAFITNIDPIEADGGNPVDIGIWDPDTDKFYPFARLKPQQAFPMPLSPFLSMEFGEGSSTGTGTTGASVNTLRVRGLRRSVNVVIEAFEA